jgi:hypothetical protein
MEEIARQQGITFVDNRDDPVGPQDEEGDGLDAPGAIFTWT